MSKPKVSLRGRDWRDFAIEVGYHIDNYTVPQYGDKGEDQVTEWSTADLIKQIQKYCGRFGRNSRPGQDKLDMMKVAHYAQMIFDKIEKGD